VKVKNIAVGLAGVGIVGAIALGNSVAFADDSTTGNQSTLTSTTQMGPNMGHRGPVELATAAEFLGLTEDELLAELQSGKTLAEVAKAQGKSVQGLIDALVADATAKITELVNNPLPAKPDGFGPKGGHHGPMGSMGEDYDLDGDADYSSEESSETGVTE